MKHPDRLLGSSCVLSLTNRKRSETVSSDLSGGGNDGAVTGADLVHNGYSFEGSPDVIDCGSGATLDFSGAGKPFTCLGWFIMDDVAANVCSLMGAGIPLHTNGDNGYYLSYISSSNVLIFDTYTIDTRYALWGLKTDWVSGTPYFIACTWDGAGYKEIYVNAVLDINEQSPGVTIGSQHAFTVGVAGPRDYTGDIRHVAVYNRVLSQAELMNIYGLTRKHYGV